VLGYLNLLHRNIQLVFWQRSANSNYSKLSPMKKRMSAMPGDAAKEITAALKHQDWSVHHIVVYECERIDTIIIA